MRGRFSNPWPGGREHGVLDVARWMLGDHRRRTHDPVPKPPAPPPASPSFRTPHAPDGALTLTWIGHSSFLAQMGGRNVLLDPVWSTRVSPTRLAGPRRHVAPGFPIGELPPIDLVAISHDHYDHLDAATVRHLVAAHPTARWIAPLGVGRWLRRRGADVAAELGWWEHAVSGGLTLTCLPAQHFSGRSLLGRNRTLWCGWHIRAGERAIVFAGDTGLHPEFGTIAQRLGPLDAAMLPIGAYDPRWLMRPVHMDPDEAVTAYRALVAGGAGATCVFVAMHWGTFRLTDEPLAEPPARTREAWRAAALPQELLWIPQQGETRAW